MADYVHEETEKRLKALEVKIEKLYRQADKQVATVIREWFAQFEMADKEKQAQAERGEITASYYRRWRQLTMARGEKLMALQRTLTNLYTAVYKSAIQTANKASTEVYATARNYSAYELEKQTGLSYADYVGPGTVQEQWEEGNQSLAETVTTEQLVGYTDENERKYREYSNRIIRDNLTAGTLSTKPTKALSSALTAALGMALLSAAKGKAVNQLSDCENAGKIDAWKEESETGIELYKIWRATLDPKTRLTHQEADGQERELDEPFEVGGYQLMEPRDASLGAPAEETERCRCTCERRVKGIDRDALVRAARDVVPPSQFDYYGWGDSYRVTGATTYADWIKMKQTNGQVI